jgi:hypothetical protein
LCRILLHHQDTSLLPAVFTRNCQGSFRFSRTRSSDCDFIDSINMADAYQPLAIVGLGIESLQPYYPFADLFSVPFTRRLRYAFETVGSSHKRPIVPWRSTQKSLQHRCILSSRLSVPCQSQFSRRTFSRSRHTRVRP